MNSRYRRRQELPKIVARGFDAIARATKMTAADIAETAQAVASPVWVFGGTPGHIDTSFIINSKMGFAKERQIQEEEQGWSFSDYKICFHFVSDPFLKTMLREDTEYNECSDFQRYFNGHRSQAGLEGRTPEPNLNGTVPSAH